MDVVLGIDNIVFLSILAGRLPENRRTLAFCIGLGLAWLMRIGLRSIITWFMGLIQPVFPHESLGTQESGFQSAHPSDSVAMAFALIVEVLNIRMRTAKQKAQAATH